MAERFTTRARSPSGRAMSAANRGASARGDDLCGGGSCDMGDFTVAGLGDNVRAAAGTTCVQPRGQRRCDLERCELQWLGG
ncbi:ABC transporter ATP-binding protein, partial [Sesbania bispinosa]